MAVFRYPPQPQIQDQGVAVAPQPIVNFSTGLAVAQDAGNNRVNVTTTGAAPTGSAGGDLSGTYPNPTVDVARGLVTPTGPTELIMGAVADLEFLSRFGSTIIGSPAPAVTFASVAAALATANAGIDVNGFGFFDIASLAAASGGDMTVTLGGDTSGEFFSVDRASLGSAFKVLGDAGFPVQVDGTNGISINTFGNARGFTVLNSSAIARLGYIEGVGTPGLATLGDNTFYFVDSASAYGWSFANSGNTPVLTIGGDGDLKIIGDVGFFNTAPQAKPTVSGSKGANAALGSLMTALSNLGLVTDSTS